VTAVPLVLLLVLWCGCQRSSESSGKERRGEEYRYEIRKEGRREEGRGKCDYRGKDYRVETIAFRRHVEFEGRR
jgi:hypothetical protein